MFVKALKYRVKWIWNWIHRMGYSRGFGVQSPSAYSFIRYVLTEHYPYYAYDELKMRFKSSDHATKKKGRLYFRLANYAQASHWFDYHSAEQPYAAYVHEGCRKTVFQAIDGKTIPNAFRIARLSMTEDYQAVYEALCKVATDDSILILEGINDNKDTKAFWKRVQESQKATRTYDLFLCGIIVFDTSKHKHHYIVNF
ncbi:hypothetical protein [Segatella salivae]|jgi:hypothetical protein|uniref:hypothetical protein n=1 Tax=Segatella salivae TaxID=228604 RepID=UPI00241C2619|nr:hypothetical protein [Segatella salivae]